MSRISILSNSLCYEAMSLPEENGLQPAKRSLGDGAPFRHGMQDRVECICGYKRKTVLCVAKALSELNVWRSGDVHPGNKDINICCFVCQNELPFLENCVWFSLKGTFLLSQQPRRCCQSQCSTPHTNQSPAPESTKLEDREGESYLVVKLSTCSAGANNHRLSHERQTCFRE